MVVYFIYNVVILIVTISNSNMRDDKKIGYDSYCGCLLLVVISLALFIYSIVLYILMNNNGETSTVKNLLLAYWIMQIVSTILIVWFVCFVWVVCYGCCGYFCFRFGENTKVFCCCGYYYVGLGEYAEVLGWLLLLLPIAITGILAIISYIANIVLAGLIVSDFLIIPWTSTSVSYDTMSHFVILASAVHGIKIIFMILFGYVIVIGCMWYINKDFIFKLLKNKRK